MSVGEFARGSVDILALTDRVHALGIGSRGAAPSGLAVADGGEEDGGSGDGGRAVNERGGVEEEGVGLSEGCLAELEFFEVLEPDLSVGCMEYERNGTVF